jgi:predicted phage-related endonuclease
MLQKIPIGHQTRDEWIGERSSYIGGTDSSTILIPNDYTSKVELFYQKLGEYPLSRDNRFSFMGRYMEDSIADLFQYWDGEEENLIRNYSSGTKVRETRRTNFRFVNDRWPWLSCNLDRFYRDLTSGERGIIDCKNMMEWVEKKWELGIPYGYIVQITQYMGILGMNKAYIVILVGGNRLEVYPIEFSQPIFDGIVRETKDFWDRIVRAREVMAETGATGDELVAMLSYQGIEPEPEYNAAYEDYLKKRSVPEEGMRQGTQKDLENAYLLHATKAERKAVEEKETRLRTMLQQSIGPAEGIEFPGTKNKVTWIPNKKGERSLRLYLEDVMP